MSDNEMKLAQALHEASVYGIGATSDVNQRVILEAAKAFAAAASAEPVAWSEEDYRRARDCMRDILRNNRAWTISKDQGEKEFDGAF